VSAEQVARQRVGAVYSPRRLALEESLPILLEARTTGPHLVGEAARAAPARPGVFEAAGRGVGAENSSDTLRSRRTASAFRTSLTEVVSTNRPSSGCHRVTRCQVIGVPPRARFENSQVRNSRNTASTSGGSTSPSGRGFAPSQPAGARSDPQVAVVPAVHILSHSAPPFSGACFMSLSLHYRRRKSYPRCLHTSPALAAEEERPNDRPTFRLVEGIG
jgi:hypothetical protein